MTAPERIWAQYGGDMLYVNPTEGSWRAYGNRGTEYILHTRAALAASPLVQEIVAEAVKAEREACRQIAVDYDAEHANPAVAFNTASAIAAAIRARGEG